MLCCMPEGNRQRRIAAALTRRIGFADVIGASRQNEEARGRAGTCGAANRFMSSDASGAWRIADREVIAITQSYAD